MRELCHISNSSALLDALPASLPPNGCNLLLATFQRRLFTTRRCAALPQGYHEQEHKCQN